MIRLPETRREVQVERETAELPATALLRRLAFVGFVAMFAFTGFEATFSLFGDRRFGLTEASTSVVFLCIGVVLVTMQGGVYAKLVERHGVGTVLYGGLAFVVAGLAALAVAGSWPVLIVALALLTVGQGCASPAITSIVIDHAPGGRRGRALGFQQSATALARVAGPPVAGTLFDHAGVPSPYLAGAAVTLLALVLTMGWRLGRPPAVIEG